MKEHDNRRHDPQSFGLQKDHERQGTRHLLDRSSLRGLQPARVANVEMKDYF